MNNPVFLFSAGWRSGSTLLQRIVMSSGEVLIWGEAGGALDGFSDAFERYEQMLGPDRKRFKYGFGGNGEEQYLELKSAGKDSVHKWIACLNPPRETFINAFRAFFNSIYACPARELGFPSWGVKEVRAGIQAARFAKLLYPDAKFVFLVRNPIDCLASIKRRNWIDCPEGEDPLVYYANYWLKLAGEFREADFGYHLRYEDLVTIPEVLDELMKYLEIYSIPRDFIKTSHVDWEPLKPLNDHKLTFFERRRLLKIVNSEMDKYGYKK